MNKGVFFLKYIYVKYIFYDKYGNLFLNIRVYLIQYRKINGNNFVKSVIFLLCLFCKFM